MFIFKLIAKLVKALNSNDTPAQLGYGFALGMIIGLTPLMSLHNAVILFLLLALNVNLTMGIFSFLLFSAFAYLLDPVFHSFGYFLLADLSFMQDFYTELYNIPIIALSNFNNTVTMGSFISSLILFFPMFLLGKNFTVFYREKLNAKVQKLKIMQIIKGSKIYGLYEKFGG